MGNDFEKWVKRFFVLLVAKVFGDFVLTLVLAASLVQ